MDPEYKDRFLETTSKAATEDVNHPQTVLNAAFDAVIQGDFSRFGEFITDDVELTICGFSPMDGTWRGHDEVVAATRKNFALLGDQKPEIESMITDREHVAVLVRERGVLKSNGQAYSIRGVQWFTFANGKIKKIEEIIVSV
jgi:ketosteroid isomerase-like protein